MSEEFAIIDDHTEDEQKVELKTDDKQPSFEDRVREYVSKNNVKLAILTPCYGGTVFVNYMQCLIATRDLCSELGIKLKIDFCKNDSLVSRARNNLVARAMSDPDVTHIMFIDADITWAPVDVIKLLLTDKSLVGGVYPLKSYYWDKITKNSANENTVKNMIDRKNNSQFKDRISDQDMIQHNVLHYNINYIDKELHIEKNLAKVRHLATGFMMFKRKVIEQMSKAFPASKYTDDVGFLSGSQNDFAYALFDCGVEEGHYFSEDWLFCHRWAKMGGTIWIDVTINLMHTGIEDFKGCYIASII